MLKKHIRQRKEFAHNRKRLGQISLADNEYATAQYSDPKILVTTSRSPSERLKKFHKELALIFPNTTAMNRGAQKLKDVFDFAAQQSFSDLIIIHEHLGEPDGLIISHLPVGPTLYLSVHNAVLRHDIPGEKSTVSQANPHLIFHNFNEGPGAKIKLVLQSLFPMDPAEDCKRVLSFLCRDDFISFRHHVHAQERGAELDLEEVGPRFELRPFLLRLGNLLQTHAAVEWALHPYVNSAAKRRAITDRPSEP